jgi:membrane fusion protein
MPVKSEPGADQAERQTIRAYGVELPLEPDLKLQADILFERRTLLAWMLDPLLSAGRRS